ncbi:MAG: hypothetical protein ABIX10_15255 [Acidimicrobiales bacterium]
MKRRALRDIAQALSKEFAQYDTREFGARVKAHRGRSLELLVDAPHTVLDNFVRRAVSEADAAQAGVTFREIVAHYLAGETPPFEDDRA